MSKSGQRNISPELTFSVFEWPIVGMLGAAEDIWHHSALRGICGRIKRDGFRSLAL